MTRLSRRSTGVSSVRAWIGGGLVAAGLLLAALAALGGAAVGGAILGLPLSGVGGALLWIARGRAVADGHAEQPCR